MTTNESRFEAPIEKPPCPIDSRLHEKTCAIEGLARNKIVSGLGEPFHLKRHERKTWNTRKWKDMKGKDMKATEKTWMDMRGNEFKEMERQRSQSKDWRPKSGSFDILHPSSLRIMFLGSCRPRYSIYGLA